MWQEGGKARKASQGRAQESLCCQSHNLMFKNDDRIQIMDCSQENVTEMSQEQLQWKEKKQTSREEKVWRNYKSTAGKARNILKWLEKWWKGISWINIDCFTF